MSNPTSHYTRSLEDELDWKMLDQLHHVVSQISSFCFEIKKFCVTTEFVVLTLVVKFTRDQLDDSLFVIAAIIALCFWFLDAVAYFYQVKLRGAMRQIEVRLRSKASPQLVPGNGAFAITAERVSGAWVKRAFEAGFNHSMWLYAFLLLVDVATWLAFAFGLIAST